MKTFKASLRKTFSLLLTLSLLLLSLSLFACEGKSVPDYYNTTYTLTGNTLAVEWESEREYDVGFKQLSSSGESYSYKYLIEQYFDDIEWGSDRPADIDAAIAKIEQVLNESYKDAAGLSFAISSKENLTLTITYPEKFQIEPIVIKMAENAEDFRALYPNELRYPEGYYESPVEERFYEGSEGQMCIGVLEYKGEDGKTYDKIISFSTYSPYGADHETLGDVIGITCDVPIINTLTGSYQFESLYNDFGLWSKAVDGSASTLVSITVKPEITVQQTKQ